MRLRPRALHAALLLAVAGAALALVGPLAALAEEGASAVEVDLNDAGCFGHHAAETPPFRTTVLLTPAQVLEVPAGLPFDLPVTAQVAWKQEMRSLKIGLNLSQATNLAFVGGQDPFSKDISDRVALHATKEYPFPVEANATELVVTLAGDEGPLGNDDLDLFVVSPDGNHTYNKTVEDNSLDGLKDHKPIAHEEVRLDQAQVLDGGTGQWKAIVQFTDGLPPDDDFKLAMRVYYNASSNAEDFLPVGGTLPAGAAANVTFHLKALAPGPATILVESLGWAHYAHTDAQAVNDGNFSKQQPFTLTVGKTLRVARTAGAGGFIVGADPFTQLERQWGFLLGWTGFFLVPPALVLGGTFGAPTVRWLNRRVGTARQRVLWHNALSYVLLGVGLTHMTLFLLEPTYNWTVGIVWGSLTLSSMVGLGFTGALQNRIAKQYGYATWRFTHFMMGMLVIVFVALHVLVDGVDLQFVRDWFLFH